MITGLAVGSASMPLWSVIPFAGLLLSIAVLPLVAEHWWHSNRNKAIVAAVFGLPTGIYVATQDLAALKHTGLEYVAFIALLGSLYIVSGNIRLKGSLAGTPLGNTLVLAVGGVLANLVGTTGAAMLLIRPFLRANRRRRRRAHLVIFFIFIVANCGGCLTPLGDPPLFLGFLRGVPFQWTLGLWAPWLTVVGTLLILFNLLDQRMFHKEDVESPGVDLDEEVEHHQKLGLEGGFNFVFLLGIIGAVLASGFVVHKRFGETAALLFQAGAMAVMAALSFKLTPADVRKKNDFSWHPLQEVVILFAGIFAAMIPALSVLQANGKSLGVTLPWQYFWATGSLSSFLDNAPTYLAFVSLAQGADVIPAQLSQVGSNAVLKAISCGAVFMGAMTYIGNGPNFMVKAIAEHAGVKMPSFFGYMAWSAAVLLPVLLGVTLLYFRGA